MVERAKQLLDGGDMLDHLPRAIVALVRDYACELLREEKDPLQSIRDARAAAIVCLGEDLQPAWRSLSLYEAVGLPADKLNALARCGLMVESGSAGDPYFKFSLDPVAEYLAAWEWVVGIRDRQRDRGQLTRELDSLAERPPEEFLTALKQWTDECEKNPKPATHESGPSQTENHR
jgi:hypothetical protein